MTSTASDFASFRFSAESLPQERRVTMFQAALEHSFGGGRLISPLSDVPLRVELAVHQLGVSGNGSGTHVAACIVRMTTAGGGMVRRTPELLSDGNDDVILHIQETGSRTVSQLGREATALAGGGLLVSNAEISTSVVPDAARLVSLRVPRKSMMALVPGLENAFVRALPASCDVLRLLVRYLDVLDDQQTMMTSEVRRAVATHIHDLCALAIGATCDAAEIANGRGLRAARMRAIKSDIDKNLRGGDVSAAALSLRQRVSSRYIHKLFEGEGVTLSRFVLGQRLALVHRMLANPRYAHRTIGALAFDVGFGDLSSFNREFRRRFGVTPSDVRHAARQ